MKQTAQRELEYASKWHPEEIRRAAAVNEPGHGRIETRRLCALSVKPEHFDFPHVRQVAELVRERLDAKTGKRQTQTVYLVTNLNSSELSAAEMLRSNRSYWQVENCLHYVKDMVFGEDRCTVRAGAGPQVLSALRNLAVSLLRLMGVENIKRCVDWLRREPLKVAAMVCF